jgi:hypothetical protein
LPRLSAHTFGGTGQIMPTKVRCVRIELKPGMVERAREWASAINARRFEALKTLEDEGVTIESVFLEHNSDGDFLIYYMRAHDFDASAKAASNSVHSIDEFHQKFKEEAWAGGSEIELLIDLER